MSTPCRKDVSSSRFAGQQPLSCPGKIIMDKRTFLKAVSAFTAGPVVSPLLVWASGDKLKNWAGNIEYSTENLYAATSPDLVKDFVKNRHSQTSDLLFRF